jgi:hypothetical protein
MGIVDVVIGMVVLCLLLLAVTVSAMSSSKEWRLRYWTVSMQRDNSKLELEQAGIEVRALRAKLKSIQDCLS